MMWGKPGEVAFPPRHFPQRFHLVRLEGMNDPAANSYGWVLIRQALLDFAVAVHESGQRR